MPAVPARAAVLLAIVAAAGAANDGKLITVEQRDPLRSAMALRTVDISADGRYVAFSSWARLVPADADDLPDVYVLDRSTGRVTLESEGDAKAENSHPRISGDGQRVVFETRPVTQDMPRIDLALRDRAAATIRLLTDHSRDGPFDWSRQADISDDGQVVVFSSASTTLVAGADANGRREDVYSLQLATGRIERESVTTAGVQLAAGVSHLSAVSGDGRYIAFASTAPLDADPSRSATELPSHQVFLRDRIARTTTRISRQLRGARSAGGSTTPSISADGRYVAFASDSDDIAGGARQGSDVFLVDRTTMAATLVSRAACGGNPNGVSLSPVISGDGRFVVFQSDASNLVCASRCLANERDVNLIWDVFLFDRVAGRIVRMSEDELGGWMEWSAGPAIDAAGQVVAFSSHHPTDALDQRHDLDLFVRRR